jgi:hypothetical protein
MGMTCAVIIGYIVDNYYLRFAMGMACAVGIGYLVDNYY